jgi:hypothetical protein
VHPYRLGLAYSWPWSNCGCMQKMAWPHSVGNAPYTHKLPAWFTALVISRAFPLPVLSNFTPSQCYIPRQRSFFSRTSPYWRRFYNLFFDVSC